jgi:hypothetical protein
MTALFVAIATMLFFPVLLNAREMIHELFEVRREVKGK